MGRTEFARISGSYSTAFIGSWERIGQNISGNYSVIRLYGTFYYGGGTSVGSTFSSFSIKGNRISSGSYRHYPGNHDIGHVDITVYHNADGTFPTQTIKIEASSYHMSGTATGTISGVEKIKRASTFSVSPSTIVANENMTATIYKADSSFYHQLTLSIGDLNTHTSLSNSGTISLKVPQDFAKKIPNYSTGTAKVLLETYSSNNMSSKLGSSEKNVTLQVPNKAPFTPTMNVAADPVEADPAEIVKVPDSWIEKVGETEKKIFVQGVSTVKLVAYSVWAKSNASIQKVTFDSNKGEKDNSAAYPTYTFSIKNYSKSGNQSVSVRATDSRGNYTDQKLKFYVYPYQKPTVNVLCCERCRADGTASDSGTCLKVRARCSFSSVGARNSASIKVEFRKVGESSWTVYEDELNPDTDTVIGEDMFSTMSSYEVRFIATDLLGGTGERTVRIPTQSVVMNVRPGGNGVAFGKYAEEENLMDIKFPVRTGSDVDVGGALLMGGVPLVESVISKDPKEWSYRKWADGTAECWVALGEVEMHSITEEWVGSGTYFREVCGGPSYPAGLFISRPACVISCPADNFPGWIRTVGRGEGYNHINAPGICACVTVSRTSTLGMTFHPSYYAIGRWDKEEQTTQQQSGGNQDGNL